MNLITISTTCGILIGALGIIICIFWYGENISRKKRELLEMQKKMQASRDVDFNQYMTSTGEIISLIQKALEEDIGLETILTQSKMEGTLLRTGIPSVDSLLAYKKAICIDKNINFILEISSFSKELLSEAEYVSLLGNLIDNGMEAAEGIVNPWVEVTSKTVRNQWILRVRNGKSPDCTPIINKMITTKVDGKDHGIGTKIINKIVKEHKGIIERTDLGESFEVFIIFDRR